MCVDGVDGVHDHPHIVLALFGETVRHLADRDGNVDALQALPHLRDLLRELLGREDSVEERFAAELDCAGDELGFRIGEEYVSQFVPPADPAIVAVKSELR